ncbi:unnamed protein product [Albugo candida]|uniref:Uncharacterized protein n=1 Tax=Albugo candida TaxID=65357 RepID=A0A024FU32_9STRA|nr:unnamed protein product [Albugo candida]|eukprot:CCI10432.1 unnamed protein product [Albugo candida]
MVRYIVETYAIANSSKCRNLRFAFLSIGFLGDTEESVLALHYMVIEDIISTWIFNVIYEGILSPWECIYAHMLATQQRGCQWWIIAFRLSIQVAKSQLLMDCILSHKIIRRSCRALIRLGHQKASQQVTTWCVMLRWFGDTTLSVTQNRVAWKAASAFIAELYWDPYHE